MRQRTTYLSNCILVVTAGIFLTLAGCHRQYYRKQADCEVNALLDEKASHLSRSPEVAPRIDVDRRSRMFNPFDLDFQPMPLDDPSSYEYMQCVDGRRGYPMWEAAGVTNTAESPDWWQFLPLDDDGVLVLNAENAVRIALLHSPDYQAQLEQLYLSALKVSNERFVFDTQFYGGAQTFLTTSGRRRSGNGQSRTEFQVGTYDRGGSGLSLERRFATGATLVTGLANSIVWQLSGPDTQNVNTILDFSLIQPLLRGAGRDVVLEDLTRSERDLLANVRAFERYRRSFFLRITTGRGVESTVGLNGPSFAISGQAFGAGGGSASGFLGLLQTQLQIRNLEENIARQTENLLILDDTLIEQLTKLPENPATGTGEILNARLQVAQARSSLVRSQTDLIGRQAGYKRSVDQFMRELGLPPYVCARFEDPILQRFELIDRELLGRRQQLADIRIRVGQINVNILQEAEYKINETTGMPESQLRWSDSIVDRLSELREALKPLDEFSRILIDEDSPRITTDIDLLVKSIKQREAQNGQLKSNYQSQKGQICSLIDTSNIDDSLFDIDDLSTLSDELRATYDLLITRLQSYQKRIETLESDIGRYVSEGPENDDPIAIGDVIRGQVIIASQDLLTELADDVLLLQLIQARARTESVLLPEVEIDPTTALQIARVNRRDWANARADLVNQWRLIEVIGDSLESNLDLVFNGDVSNVGRNPLNLNSTTGQLRVGLRWDAPLTRLVERNNYRNILIGYEQSKRDFYSFEDSVWQQLRAEIRQLQANRLTFELGRQAVGIAASQIELNTDIRSNKELRGQGTGPTAARDAISALNDLLDAQNALLNIFVNYEVVRRSLDFDLGTMELTPEGLWIDPGKIDPEYLLTLSGTSQSGMVGNCNECFLPRRPLPAEPIFSSPPMEFSNGDPLSVEESEAESFLRSN